MFDEHGIALEATMRLAIAFAALTTIGFLSRPAAGSPPNPATSTVPRCILACPQGDISDTVVVRGVEGAPQSNVQVVMDFSQCPEISLCPTQVPPPYVVLSPTQIAVMSDNLGQAIFALQVKGTCAGGVRIIADGVILTYGTYYPTRPLVNVDQNGDGAVTDADRQILASRAANDPLGDLNCDGFHDVADMNMFAAHLGHQCQTSLVPVHARDWGSVKIHYR